MFPLHFSFFWADNHARFGLVLIFNFRQCELIYVTFRNCGSRITSHFEGFVVRDPSWIQSLTPPRTRRAYDWIRLTCVIDLLISGSICYTANNYSSLTVLDFLIQQSFKTIFTEKTSNFYRKIIIAEKS